MYFIRYSPQLSGRWYTKQDSKQKMETTIKQRGGINILKSILPVRSNYNHLTEEEIIYLQIISRYALEYYDTLSQQTFLCHTGVRTSTQPHCAFTFSVFLVFHTNFPFLNTPTDYYWGKNYILNLLTSQMAKALQISVFPIPVLVDSNIRTSI